MTWGDLTDSYAGKSVTVHFWWAPDEAVTFTFLRNGDSYDGYDGTAFVPGRENFVTWADGSPGQVWMAFGSTVEVQDV